LRKENRLLDVMLSAAKHLESRRETLSEAKSDAAKSDFLQNLY
jgi:hypothetical protein